MGRNKHGAGTPKIKTGDFRTLEPGCSGQGPGSTSHNESRELALTVEQSLGSGLLPSPRAAALLWRLPLRCALFLLPGRTEPVVAPTSLDGLSVNLEDAGLLLETSSAFEAPGGSVC